jgi:hypothetical protein
MVRCLEIEGGRAIVEGAYREGVVAVVAASTPMSSMVNFGTGAKKKRWGLRAHPGGRRKGVRGKETGDAGTRHFLKLAWR